uniref:Transmembrane protein n=1 Tax=Musa acuminata subsp. malaccensis TaxID=214687 RepID=A0A804JWT7_MUSAM
MVLCSKREISKHLPLGILTLSERIWARTLKAPNFFFSSSSSSSSSPSSSSSSLFLSLIIHAAAFSASLRTKAERLKRWDLSFCAFCSLVLVFIIFTIRSLGFTYRSSDSFFFFF